MASFYSVVLTGSNQMQISGNKGEVAFNVTNTSASPLQTRFDLGRVMDGDNSGPGAQAFPHPTLAPDSPLRKWLKIQTAPLRIDSKGTVQVVVKLEAPPDTEGSYRFCIIAAAAPRTDEDFTVGPPVTFNLAKTGSVKPPFKLKWWMILIAAVVLIAIVGGVLYFILRSKGVPDVVGKSSRDASQALEKAGLQVKINDVLAPGKPDGIVLNEKPSAGSDLPKDKIVVLDVVSSLATVPCVEKLTLSAAVEKLEAAGLQFDASTLVTDGAAPSGSVVSQNPRFDVCTPNAAGLKVAPGSKVFLTIEK